MAKGLSPIIGLAVVVALAMVAVFGAVSLTNPAWAQNEPDDTVTVYEGVDAEYNAAALFSSEEDLESFVNNDDQDPTGVLTNVTALSGADAGKFTLSPTDLGPGVSDAYTVLTFKQDHDGDDDDADLIEKTVGVTVMASVAASRAKKADGTPTDIPEIVLYTEVTSVVDISEIFEAGTGSGMIVGYSATATAVTHYSVTDTVTDDAALEVGADGMVTLVALATVAAEVADLTVVPYCPTGPDAVAICNDEGGQALGGAVVEVSVAMPFAAKGSDEVFDDLTLDVGVSMTIDLKDADGDDIYFISGPGTGEIESYTVVSDTDSVVAASLRRDTILLRTRAAGDALITVTAKDGHGDSDPIKDFLVTVESGYVPDETELVDDADKAQFTLVDLASADGKYPGDMASGYTVSFEAAMDYTPFDDTIEIMMEDFGVPSPIIKSRVTLDIGGDDGPQNPEEVTVDGTTVTLTVPDFDTSPAGEQIIEEEDTVIITFLATADITTPVYSGDYNWVVEGIVTVDIEVDGEARAVTPPVADGLPSFTQSSNAPGDAANYTVMFEMTSNENTRLDDLIIEFHEDYGVPGSISNASVAITTKLGDGEEVTFTPELVTVDGEKILLSLGDMDESAGDQGGTDYQLDNGEVVTVHFRQSAGITTPTEAKGYNLVGVEFGGTSFEYKAAEYDGQYGEKDAPNHPRLKSSVIRKISLSDEDGGLNDPVDATGKGFKNGTTLTVFVDQPTNVMWDHDGDYGMPDATPMVLLTFDSAADATAQSRGMYTNNWQAYLDAVAAEDGPPKMNVQVVDTAPDNAGLERPLFMVAHPDATATSPWPG